MAINKYKSDPLPYFNIQNIIMEILTGPFSANAVVLPLGIGIFHSTTPSGIFPFLGATKLHIHLKTSQYFLNMMNAYPSHVNCSYYMFPDCNQNDNQASP